MSIISGQTDRQIRRMGWLMDIVMEKMLGNLDKTKWVRMRKMTAMAFIGKKCKGVLNSEVWIPCTKEDTKIRVRIYKPLSPEQNVPGVLWLHGGGYAIGVPEQSHAIIKRLIADSGCVVVAPDYSLSVDKPYPAALEDAYTTLLWLKNHANELGIRSDQLMVGGESAGGGLTAALSLYARDKGEVNIAFQMPLYPMIDDRMNTKSAIDNHAPVWNSRYNSAAWQLYLGDLFGKDVPPYAAAARAEDLRGIPPTCTFVGGIEPFRDETVTYVQNLREAGIPVDFELYEGAYHGFAIMNPKADISRRAEAFFINSFHHAVLHYFAEQVN